MKKSVYKIGGYDVRFPGKPYGTQMAVMDKILKSITRCENALIEAPTGTGKSLALICASLAWQSDYKKKAFLHSKVKNKKVKSDVENQPKMDEVEIKDEEIESQMEPISLCSSDEDDDFEEIPSKSQKPSVPSTKKKKVEKMEADIPSSNLTSSSSSDIPTESYTKIPQIFLGSRTHSQLDHLIHELKQTEYHPKMSILASREHYCIHPQVSLSKQKNADCKHLNKNSPGCSFKNKKRDLVYDCMGRFKSVEGFVFDIEELVSLGHSYQACPYYSAQDLAKEAELVLCPYNYLIDPIVRIAMKINLTDAIIIIDEAHNLEDVCRSAASFDADLTELEETQIDLGLEREFSDTEKYNEMLKIINWLVSFVKENTSNLTNEGFEHSSKVWTGEELVGLLSQIGVTPENFSVLKEKVNEIMAEFFDPSSEEEFLLSFVTIRTIETLFVALDFLLSYNLKYVQDFKMVLQKISRENSKKRKYWSYSLGIWCMNPAVAFLPIAQQARSVILTSGTLNPMDSFEYELGVSFQHRLETAHIISQNQIWVSAIGSRKSVTLNGTFKHSDSFLYQDAIGDTLIDYCKIIPNGTLCFFPSYQMLFKFANRWKVTNTWKELSSIKEILIEPQSNSDGELDGALETFYEAVRESIEKKTGGALFLAVFRGKLSEGFDFVNENCRGVFCIGIPFPYIKDLKIKLKKTYNDEKAQDNTHLQLSGKSWYELQAYRALNQAVGRCIRHKNDWGAIILLDTRMNHPTNQSKLSKWIRKNVNYFPTYEQSLFSLQDFVSNLQDRD